MSEHAPKHESELDHEKLVSHEHHERAERERAAAAEQARAEKSQQNLELLRQAAKQEAKEAQELSHEKQSEPDADALFGMQQDMKDTAYKRTLANTQRKLPKAAREFSKVVHNEAVERVSAVSGQTVARPSGLLGGGLCAFLGSLALLYYSKHYGFHYNYLMIVFLFVGGFAIGALLELAVWSVYSRRRR
jgi:hypothetical protein